MAQLTTQEAADRLGVTRIRVLQFIREGRIRATKFGWQWSIDERALDAVRDRKAGRRWPRKDKT